MGVANGVSNLTVAFFTSKKWLKQQSTITLGTEILGGEKGCDFCINVFSDPPIQITLMPTSITKHEGR